MVLSMDRWIGKVAVITGAGSGIGAAVAKQLVEQGLQVVALDKRKDRLNELANKLTTKKGKLFPIETDTTKEEEVLNAFRWIKENLGHVHILVNCAGILEKTNLTDGDTETWQKTFQVNVIGTCIATREAIKDMRANNINGHIIHINSLAGHQVPNSPEFNVYPASKHAITALAETLRLELNSLNLKIKITSISPGAVDTNLVWPDFDIKQLYEENKIMEPEQIADAVVYALSTPPHVQIQEITIRPIFCLDIEL